VPASREPSRLILFTDAVTAIAVTLLVLPLAEVVPEAMRAHETSVEVITRHQPEIWTFLLSFGVIIRLWLVHHRTFAHIRAYSHALLLLNFGWLLAIVVLPFPTEMVGAYGGDRFTVGVYIGTILVANSFQTAMTLTAYRDPAVASETDPLSIQYVIASCTASGLLLCALILALAVPDVNYWALLLLFFSPAVESAWLRFRDKDAPGRSKEAERLDRRRVG
jgi:uncharacterized membrane protein